MQLRRVFRSVSTFVGELAGAIVKGIVKAVVTTVVLAALIGPLMHYMRVPVPSADDLIGGLSELARVLS